MLRILVLSRELHLLRLFELIFHFVHALGIDDLQVVLQPRARILQLDNNLLGKSAQVLRRNHFELVEHQSQLCSLVLGVSDNLR